MALYNEKYQSEFCEDIIRHMSQGKSIASFIAYLYDKYNLRITRKTITNWRKSHPEFDEAVEVGKSRALSFFESLLISATTGVMPKQLIDQESSGVNMSGVIFALKTRFHKDYGDLSKIDLSSKDGSVGNGLTVIQRKAIAERILLDDPTEE